MRKKVFRVLLAIVILIFCAMIAMRVFIAYKNRPQAATYSGSYIVTNNARIQIEVPEVYELANIAIAISNFGLENPNAVRKQGDYYDQVMERFLPFKDHPLIAKIDSGIGTSTARFYAFRENSVRYAFEGDRIVPGGTYPESWRSSLDIFTENLQFVEDFSRQSQFREFYRINIPSYERQIQFYRDKVRVRRMWVWLESHFSQRYDSYKIVFSPLIGGSHSTRRCEDNGFAEVLAFISGPRSITSEQIDKVREGLLERMVFTEIDHNYVNPTTWNDWFKVGRAFRKIEMWNRQEGYQEPMSTFNEYMTWAVFLLYARDQYEDADFEEIESSVVNTMVDQREFVLFEQFGEKLLELYQNRKKGQTVVDLYPGILSWATEIAETEPETPA